MIGSHYGRSDSAVSFTNWTSAPHLKHPRTTASSEQLGWCGFDLRVGVNEGCDLDSVLIDGHYIGIQLNDDAINVETRGEDGWSEMVNPPRAIWIQPEGSAFSLRHRARSQWAGVVLQPSLLDAAMGQPRALRKAHVIFDDLLAHLLSSLISQITAEDQQIALNTRLSEGVIQSFLLALGSRYSAPLPQCGGVSPHQLKSLYTWVEENVAEKLSVASMADHLGLSAGHFAREFKRSTGKTPWEYVTDIRADLARKYLEQGERAGIVAFRCGFADQAHLCRVLKSRLGLSPSKIQRRRVPIPAPAVRH